jgi:hypothetical protein
MRRARTSGIAVRSILIGLSAAQTRGSGNNGSMKTGLILHKRDTKFVGDEAQCDSTARGIAR